MLPGAVLGYSMGGVIALRLAVARPDGRHRTGARRPGRDRLDDAQRRDLARRHGGSAPGPGDDALPRPFARRPRLRAPLALWGAADPRALAPDAVLGFLGALPSTRTSAAPRALVTDDPRPDLDRVGCRTLLVWGARDRLVPLADGFEYARRLRAPIRTLAASGHLVVGEPRPLRRGVEGFLETTGDRRRCRSLM